MERGTGSLSPIRNHSTRRSLTDLTVSLSLHQSPKVDHNRHFCPRDDFIECACVDFKWFAYRSQRLFASTASTYVGQMLSWHTIPRTARFTRTYDGEGHRLATSFQIQDCATEQRLQDRCHLCGRFASIEM